MGLYILFTLPQLHSVHLNMSCWCFFTLKLTLDWLQHDIIAIINWLLYENNADIFGSTVNKLAAQVLPPVLISSVALWNHSDWNWCKVSYYYLGMSMDVTGLAGWLLGGKPPPAKPRAELYSSKGDWKATWACSGGGISLSLAPIFSMSGRALDDDLSPVVTGSDTWPPFLLLSPNCLIRSGWIKKQLINIQYKHSQSKGELLTSCKLTCFSGSFIPVAATFNSKSFSLKQRHKQLSACIHFCISAASASHN